MPDTVDAAFPRVLVGPVPVSLVEPDALVDWVDHVVSAPDAGCRIVNHLAAHPVVEARRDPALATILARADCNVADGMGTVWAARVLGGTDQPRARSYGPDVMLDVLARGLDRGWRHGFVGGTPQVLPRLLDRLASRLPGLQVAGAHPPPFRDVDADAVAEDLAALGTGPDDVDVLWVGLGVPKQLVWADLARAHRPARVIMTVGAAFDFHAGVAVQAPTWMQDHGLEWLHRLGQDPRRLAGRYLVGNARHVAGVAGDYWRRGRQDARRASA